jgi:hypothetical protein
MRRLLEIKIFFYVILLFIIVNLVFLWHRYQGYKKIPDYGFVVTSSLANEGGHLLPNCDLLLKGERFNRPVRFITNSKGFRNSREFVYKANKKTLRLMLLGDSYIDGYRVDQNHTMGYVLEDELNKTTKDDYDHVEVMVSGHNNPLVAAYYFQEIGRKFNPNMVILGVSLGNDLTWKINSGINIEPIKNDIGNWSVRRLEEESKKYSFFLLPKEAYTPKESFSEIFQNMEKIIRKLLGKLFFKFALIEPPAFDPSKDSMRRHLYANDCYVALGLFYKPLMPEIEEIYTNFEKDLLAMKSIVEENESKLVIVFLPTRIQVSTNDWNLLKKFYSLDEKKFDLVYPNIRISDFCKKNDIYFIDLLDEFRESTQKNDKILFMSRGDMHFNKEGHRLAGTILAKEVNHMLSNGYLKTHILE